MNFKIRSIEGQAIDYLEKIANNETVSIDCGLDTQAEIILNYVSKLKQENQQLKEQLKIKTDGFDSTIKELCEISEKFEQSQKVLNEIREYIIHEWNKREQIGVCNKELQQWEVENILQIIDKAYGVYNNESISSM